MAARAHHTQSNPERAGLDDRSSRRYLDTCHTPREERHQPVAVAAAEDTGLLPQHLDDLLDDLNLVVLIGILILQVRVFATHEPDTQHDSCHVRKVVRRPSGRLACHACSA
jgi:hypothetical protein